MMGCFHSKRKSKLAKKNSPSSSSSLSSLPLTTPLTTQINFQFIKGRRFHNVSNSEYFLPNDDDECDRLHMQHFLLKNIWGGNFSAPVEDILNQKNSKVLDVGYVLLFNKFFLFYILNN